MNNEDDKPIFPASTSNQIPYAYYAFLKGQNDRGTLKVDVLRVEHRHGNLHYETFHNVNHP